MFFLGNFLNYFLRLPQERRCTVTTIRRRALSPCGNSRPKVQARSAVTFAVELLPGF